MILSHQHRFIFLKTKKTGGTSVELALSEICGPDDIITTLPKRDEALRRGRKPQHYEIPRKHLSLYKKLRLALGIHPRKVGTVFYNHMKASQLRPIVDEAAWNSYLKVSIERNPWDREVSYYYWHCKEEGTRPSFEEYVTTDRWRVSPINNYEIYTLDGKPVPDLFLRYENLEEDFDAFIRRLGITDVPPLPGAKGQFRPEATRNYRSMYNDRTREAVARLYAPEIRLFGYEF